MTYTLGIDVSKWQGIMDWAKAEARMRALNPDGKAFAIVRAGSVDGGGCYYDDQYYGNVDYVKDLDECGFYWYFRPLFNLAAQQEFFTDLIEQEFGPLAEHEWGSDHLGRYFVHNGKKVRLFADCEDDGGLLPSVLTTRINAFMPPADLYSRANWLNDHTTSDITKTPRSLWIARYANLQGPWSDYAQHPEYKPRDWDTWSFWQFSAGGNGRGAEFGAQSASIDLNYANGQLVPLAPAPEPEPEPEPSEDWQVIFDALNTVNVKLDTVLANQASILDKLDGLDDLPPPPDPEPEPPPAVEWQRIKVTRDPVANAFFVIGWNQSDKGPKPIMAIYQPRVQFVVDQTLNAYPDKVDADGSIDFWRLAPEHVPAGLPDLYLRADQVTKV